jgi:hypothetical protein
MALKPKKFKNKYHLSDTILTRAFDNDGAETFRGSGTDYSEKDDSIIYIANVPLKRVVSLKAFIETAKYNIAKTVELSEEQDKNSKVFTTLDGDLDIDVTINIPAHSTNEARNNLAKIEELQRLISPNSGYIDPTSNATLFVDKGLGVIPPVFRVWFKNIICSGKPYSTYSTPPMMEFSSIMKHGFPCVIDSVVYEPDLSAGFLELGNFLYPKVIKLTLKLTMETSQVNIRELPIEGFTPIGNYSPFDNKYFPFAVRWSDRKDSGMEMLNDPTTRKVVENTSFFMALEGTKTKRWVTFKPFLESFTREHGTNVTYANSKERVGKLIASDQSVTFKNLSYKFKLSIPAADLGEAQVNCAKIQFLMRMFYRPPQPLDTQEIGSLHSASKRERGKREYISLSNRRIKVYSPSFVEKAGSSVKHDNLTFDFMYKNAVPMFLNSLSVDIDFEAGFFEDGGHLYPKAMSIDLDFIYDSNDLIKTYTLEGSTYRMQAKPPDLGPAHLFPFNRRTVKLG